VTLSTWNSTMTSLKRVIIEEETCSVISKRSRAAAFVELADTLDAPAIVVEFSPSPMPIAQSFGCRHSEDFPALNRFMASFIRRSFTPTPPDAIAVENDNFLTMPRDGQNPSYPNIAPQDRYESMDGSLMICSMSKSWSSSSLSSTGEEEECMLGLLERCRVMESSIGSFRREIGSSRVRTGYGYGIDVVPLEDGGIVNIIPDTDSDKEDFEHLASTTSLGARALQLSRQIEEAARQIETTRTDLACLENDLSAHRAAQTHHAHEDSRSL